MKIAIASDHGGYRAERRRSRSILKDETSKWWIWEPNSEESVDYPIYGKACGEAVMSGKADRGIVCCGTGIGISIAANKVKGIRCALCTDIHMAEMSRKHNDSNVLSLGGRTDAGGYRLWKSWEPGWTLNLRAAAIREEWTCSTHKTAPHALACFRRKTGRREGMTGGAGFA